MSKQLYVINLRGEKELFSWQKVYKSAKRAGASSSLSRNIADKIERDAYQGIKTSEIFKQIRKFLREKSPQAGLKFNLKKAMRMLGPTGFAFERYAVEIFAEKGFKIEPNKIVSGHCCRYEIDFVAEDDKTIIFGECKYRNKPGARVDITVALQNYARFLDIKNSNFLKDKDRTKKAETLLVTNAKFTSEAIKYSNCVGTGLLGWRYPKKQGLEYFIEKHKLYPITILPSFRRALAPIFADENMMLVQNVLTLDIEKFAKQNGLALKQLQSLVKEAKILLS